MGVLVSFLLLCCIISLINSVLSVKTPLMAFSVFVDFHHQYFTIFRFENEMIVSAKDLTLMDVQ